MRSYTALKQAPQWDAKGGDLVELDLDPGTEDTFVRAGLIEIRPRTYKVVGSAEVHDTAPGATFEAALPLDQETALLAGNHLEVVAEETFETLKKAELQERAAALNIEGRSQMTKDELVAAIRSADEETRGGNG